MTRTCSVPNCRANLDSQNKRTCFKFPENEELRKLWIRKIHRENFVLGKHSAVCIDHFTEEQLIRVDKCQRPDGSWIIVDRKIPKLVPDAYPCIFPNCPSYLNECTPPKRKCPEQRKSEHLKREEVIFKETLAKDTISNFEDFSTHGT